MTHQFTFHLLHLDILDHLTQNHNLYITLPTHYVTFLINYQLPRTNQKLRKPLHLVMIILNPYPLNNMKFHQIQYQILNQFNPINPYLDQLAIHTFLHPHHHLITLKHLMNYPKVTMENGLINHQPHLVILRYQ